MRVLSYFVAAILVILAITQIATASESGKSICVPISVQNGTVNPNSIPPVIFFNVSNRGVGLYNLGVSLCNAAAVPPALSACGNITGYVAIANATTCLGAFDKALMRPTPDKDGFKVKYGSSTSPKDDFEAMILCNPFADTPDLESRSRKFAGMSPNKLGGTTYMAVFFSKVACGGNATHIPTLAPGGSSDLPSGGGSSDLPSGGSMPSGGNSPSGEPTFAPGGTSPADPVPSGSGSAPGGSGSNIPIPTLPSGVPSVPIPRF